MKTRFTIYDSRFTIWKKSAEPADFNRQSSIVSRKSQRGIALILTLILLSVALVMALAFLAISGRERNSVTTQTDTATTRLAANAALAAAEAQIAANVLATTNPYSFGLLVSTNYLPPPTGNPLADLTNLFISPRAPVWLTNYITHSMENRFYLDLNRNGRDDPNGWIADTDDAGRTNGIVSFQVGDPEWIGVLEHPDQPYGPNNQFIARYAFIALPVGNSLDLNAIYNQAVTRSVNPASAGADGFLRNQGVGSWELNLAAFLTDLNTNQWDPLADAYNYREWMTPNFVNQGAGFEDALSLLSYRYATNYFTLRPVGGFLPPGLFTPQAFFAPFQNDVDAYSDGPLQTTTAGINAIGQNVRFPWAGADNTNQFFDLTADLFDPARNSAAFTNRLLRAGAGLATYDRYSFYRLLAQMGTDTTPASGKMNLNYDNLDPYVHLVNGVVVASPPAATNFMTWTPLNFFTNAADRLLKAYTTQWATVYTNDANGVLVPGVNTNYVATFNMTVPFGVTDIPVWVSNRFVYTPAVQRLLQLAANLYDASTNGYFPSVFRPIFEHDNRGNVFIAGYTNLATAYGPNTVLGAADPQLATPFDAASLTNLAFPSFTPIRDANGYLVNVYGVPWIIGAKKGFPNFNAFTLENVFKITRKLMVTRPNTTVNYLTSPGSYHVSQQLTLNLMNLLDVECWNSYRADYTNAQQIQIFATVTNTMELTNNEGMNVVMGSSYANAISTKDWAGYGNYAIPQPNSFLYPLYSTNEPVLPDSIYTFNPNLPLIPPSPSFFVNNTLTPHWWLLMTNRLRVVMLEHDKTDNPGVWHVIDYVQLAGPDSSRDLTADIHALYDTGRSTDMYNDQWDTNRNVQGIPVGMANQIGVSGQLVSLILSPYWQNQDATWVTNQTAGFRAFLGFSPLPGMPASAQQYIAVGNASTNLQAPYSPTAMVVYQTKWGANDPLVHYQASDLTDLNRTTAASKFITPLITGQLNDRYLPWGGSPQFGGRDLNPYNLALKDPLVRSSDDWNFPNNKFPTVGWVGRVHRGTPWQTVYLKSTNLVDQAGGAGLTTWVDLTGDANRFDAYNSAPAQDRLLFDLFTTAVNDNASRGTLPVNVGAGSSNPDADLAAWSALFSGIVVPTNALGGYTVISPAGTAGVPVPAGPPFSPASPLCLGYLVQNGTNGINDVRANFVNPDGLVGSFEHVGDLLSVPALTVQSPFLTGLNPATQINDQMYEWLPQQVMSLVRDSDSPRYVIYSFAQALKPAKNGTYLGAGPYFDLVTNYQVVAEMATRAVVNFDTVRTNIISVVNGATNSISVTPPRAVIERYNILSPD